jgi:hypothetical protein
MSISEKRFRQILREEAQLELGNSSSLTKSNEPSLASSIKKGVVKGGSRFVTKKGLKFALLQALELAAKSVPVIGSLAAFVDGGVTFLMLLKDMKDLTDDLLKVSKVELSGVRSLLGEYSIFEASPEDMKKVAAGLRQNMTEEQRRELEEHWDDITDGIKELIVDFLLTIKEFTAELALPVAIAIKILPIESPIKDLLFNATRFLNKQPEAVQLFLKACSFANMTWVLPFFGFIYDYDRVSAFAEIDEIITHSVDPGRSKVSNAVGRTVQKGNEVWKALDAAGEEIADSMASGFTLESKHRRARNRR